MGGTTREGMYGIQSLTFRMAFERGWRSDEPAPKIRQLLPHLTSLSNDRAWSPPPPKHNASSSCPSFVTRGDHERCYALGTAMTGAIMISVRDSPTECDVKDIGGVTQSRKVMT